MLSQNKLLHSELTIHSQSCHLGEDGFQILRAADLSKIDYIVTVYNQGFDDDWLFKNVFHECFSYLTRETEIPRQHDIFNFTQSIGHISTRHFIHVLEKINVNKSQVRKFYVG